MSEEQNPIKKNLEETFKDFTPKEAAPDSLKKEVFNTLDTLNLIGEIAGLFTDKLTKSQATLIDIIKEPDKK